MDPNATPWRVLEDPVESAPAGASAGGPEPAPRWTIQRSTLVVGVAAVALAVGAFVLAAGTTSGGLVVVDGGSALPVLGSGGPSQPGRVRAARSRAAVLVVEIVGAVDQPGVFELAGRCPDR